MTEPTGPPPPPTATPGWLARLLPDEVPRGIAFALVAPVLAFGVGLSCFFIPVVGQILCIAFGLAPGLTQLLHLVPLDRWAVGQGRTRLRKGLWIGAAVVFLLNSACWGFSLALLKGTSFR